jgi:hypothetical protein
MSANGHTYFCQLTSDPVSGWQVLLYQTLDLQQELFQLQRLVGTATGCC